MFDHGPIEKDVYCEFKVKRSLPVRYQCSKEYEVNIMVLHFISI